MVRSSGFHIKPRSNKHTVGTAAFSLTKIPALQQLQPSRILAPFRRLYNIDHGLRQFLVGISAGSFLVLSRHSYTLTQPNFVAGLYKDCAVLAGLNFIYTAYILEPVARPLVTPLIIDDDDDEAEQNLDRYAFWNVLGADSTLGLGAVFGICAVVKFDITKMLSTNILRITRSLFGSFSS